MLEYDHRIQNWFVIIGCIVGAFLFSKTGFKDLSSLFAGVIPAIAVLGYLISFRYRVAILILVSICAFMWTNNFYLYAAGMCIGVMYMLSTDSIKK